MRSEKKNKYQQSLCRINIVVLFSAFTILSAAQPQPLVKIQNSAQEFRSSNLPIIVIDTDGQVIQNNPRIIVHMGVIDNAGTRNFLTDPFNNYDGLISIEIRGSSGQWQNWPKKQYGFETCDTFGNNRNVALLGLPAENDWILYPPYSDKSMLRNILAYRFARDMGRYASRTRFCELVLNGDYRGVYVLLEKIKRDKRRVDIAEMQTDDISGDQLTGGYIIKADRSAGEDNAGWNSPFPLNPSGQKVQYLYHYPKPSDITTEQMAYIKNYINSFETLMSRSDWKLHYQEFFDVDAFVDFWIVNELTKNVDFFSFSAFFYKDKDSKDKRLKMGPAWDFNLGFGNVNYYEGELTGGFMLDRKVQLLDKIPAWCKNLDQDPEIRELFATRWRDLRSNVLSPARINTLIDSLTTVVDEAQVRNFNRWPVLGQYVWPNNFVGETYIEEIDYLKEWIQQRCAWIDLQTADYAAVEEAAPVCSELLENYPNPFNSSTIISFRTNTKTHVKIAVYDVLGRLVTVLLDEEKSAATYRIPFAANGLAGGIYFVLVSCAEQTFYKKITFIK